VGMDNRNFVRGLQLGHSTRIQASIAVEFGVEVAGLGPLSPHQTYGE
jgi:hypothetical protein